MDTTSSDDSPALPYSTKPPPTPFGEKTYDYNFIGGLEERASAGGGLSEQHRYLQKAHPGLEARINRHFALSRKNM
eukprot:1338535-Amorphochlora_amoeboformis.AAC.1